MDFHPPSRPLPNIKSQSETHLFQSETPWLHYQLLESQSRAAENWDSGNIFPEQFSETAEQFKYFFVFCNYDFSQNVDYSKCIP